MQSEIALSKYRFEKATTSLESAKTLFNSEHYADAASSSYFCAFHCMRSVLALENIDFKKHSAVISYFQEHYIKTGKFDKSISGII